MSENIAALPVKYRRLSKRWRLITMGLPVLAILAVLHYIFRITPFNLMLTDVAYFYTVVTLLLPLVFLWIPINKKASRDSVPWYDILLFMIAVAVAGYFMTNSTKLMLQGWEAGAPLIPTIIATVFWALVIEAGRRAAGPFFTAVVLFFSVYPIFASHMPGFLWSKNFPFYQVASFHAMGAESIMGIPVHIFGTILAGYMVFAVTIQRTGAGMFFNQIAATLIGKSRGGNAKIAIVASGLFGSISGSSVSNVMTTGAFTIPAMKRDGLPPDFAGAVEACASSGGAIMPPVMGTAAFLMAEFLQIPYATIALAAAVPAILYYTCLFAQIDSYAARVGLQPQKVAFEVPPVWQILLRNLHIIVSFVAIIAILFFYRMSSEAPWIATAALLAIAMLRKETRLGFQASLNLLEALGRVLGELLSIMAAVGLIIGSLVMTGVAYSLPHEIVSLSGGNVFLMLLLGATSAFILGMGVSLSATYIFLAISVAPGLVLAGFDPLAAHLFVMYCAIWSAITPPVAMAAFAAASISGASPIKTGFQAMKLGVAKYILPFVFIFSPGLILRGPVEDMLITIPSAFLGLIVVSAGLEGYFWRLGKLTMLSRGLFTAAGLALAAPGLTTDFYGLGTVVLLHILIYLTRGRSSLAGVFIKEA